LILTLQACYFWLPASCFIDPITIKSGLQGEHIYIGSQYTVVATRCRMSLEHMYTSWYSISEGISLRGGRIVICNYQLLITTNPDWLPV